MVTIAPSYQKKALYREMSHLKYFYCGHFFFFVVIFQSLRDSLTFVIC